MMLPRSLSCSGFADFFFWKTISWSQIQETIKSSYMTDIPVISREVGENGVMKKIILTLLVLLPLICMEITSSLTLVSLFLPCPFSQNFAESLGGKASFQWHPSHVLIFSFFLPQFPLCFVLAPAEETHNLGFDTCS